ncbi:hypothetical protein B9Q03_11610, partial [Candidatus Marsarchaeota G2 archaeon OSP_D]
MNPAHVAAVDVYSWGLFEGATFMVPAATVATAAPLLSAISRVYVTVAAAFALTYMMRRQGPLLYVSADAY